VTRLSRVVLLWAAMGACSAYGADAEDEDDPIGQLPVVLTVSRLAQPISDTPGAVTIIDRDKIHRSGARTVADVLRLVPGYMVSGWNGANPTAAYHAPLDDYGIRNLVLIDGRSVYSPFYLGDTHRGMMGVMLEDIERIEVLRGSNAAAYGANAMFGVINIITRHSQDTHGTEVSVTGGEGGIADNRLRVGWGDDTASFRLSTGRQQDSGYRNAYDDKQLSQFHFRSDLRPTVDNDILLETGATELSAGEGFANQNGNPQRTVAWRDWYLHGQWRRQLSDQEEIKVTANFEEEHIRDRAPYPPSPDILLDFGGRGRRVNLEFQHQFNLAANLRSVWGLGYKHEDALSKAIYYRDDTVAFQETRAFGNLEWRINAEWLINAGLFVGNHSWTGTYAAPRLMANYHLTPDHTFRAGVTKSERTPSLFELAGDVRYFQNGALVGRTTAARGTVSPESLQTQELGYFGNLRDWSMTLDVRAYHERLRNLIDTFSYNLPVSLPATGTKVTDYANYPGLTARGIEYQWRWSPLERTELWINQNFEHYAWEDKSKMDHLPPSYATTVALFQKLPGNVNLTLSYTTSSTMTWRSTSNQLQHSRRVDARLAYPFLVGSTKIEAAVAVQAANGDQPVYLPSEKFIFERRLYGTIRLEF